MISADIKLLKKLRDETSASISDCRIALEESNNDYKKALAFIQKRSKEKAEKKKDRETSQGLVEAYIHQNGKVGALIEILCETDFVARTDEFKKLAHEIAMQVAAMDPKDVNSLLKQEYIRDSSITISDLIKQAIGKLGENIVVKKITRFSL
ncbi:MAG: translation elongation factor Ts [Candidatus Levybacteria bacterium]|nr:translation elongation factor Ts [Candidatus Levybacteria bacterium]